MITSKYIPRIVAATVCLCLLACGFIVYAANAFDTRRMPEYQKKLFGEEIIAMDIQIDGGDWQALLDTAQAKEWVSADLIINGERFSTVGIRAKGNSSLNMRSGASERYSLQFKASKYIKGQTFFGLDTFCINNMTGDATYMKDYISYDIMAHIGVATPLTNFASVSVNGEDYGFCIALERYDQSFLDRVYNTADGQLYNVKIGMGRRGDFEDMWQNVENEMPNRQQGGGMGFGNMQRGGFEGGGFGSSGGGSLVYTDDNISSYSAIFDNAIFSKNSDKDKQRVITAIENLNAGTDLEKYVDVDAVLRYLAAHTFVVNLDSYTSNMQQNYYLYERDGKITILPWDYNLAFGGFQSGNASGVVNFPIDTPVSGVNMEDRPLINKLLEIDEYMDRYHDYLWQIVEGYFESGLFESTVIALNAKISNFVKSDATAFYTYEQYEASLPVFIELGRLRALSIRGQLEGTVPSTSSGQGADSSILIDASGLNLSALGSMMGGGGMRQGGGWQDGQGGREQWQGGQGGRQNGQEGWYGGQERMPAMPDGQGSGMPAGPGEWSEGQRGGARGQPEWQERGPGGQRGGMPGGGMFDIDMGLMQQAMQILMEAGGEMTDEVRGELGELGLTEDQIEMFSNMQNRFFGGGNRQGGGFPGMGGQEPFPGGNGPWGAQLDPSAGDEAQGMRPPGWDNTGLPTGQSGSSKGYIIIIGALLALLIGATIFVARPRRHMI